MNTVLDLLEKNGVRVISKGQDWITHCFNPDHDDRNPSFRIDKTSGIAHCFSCGFKTNIFKYYGITTTPVGVKIQKLKNKLSDLNKYLNGVDFPENTIPYTKSFRGLTTSTLKKFEAFYCTTGDEKYQNRVWFPIKDVRKKIRVFSGRHVLPNGEPRYLNYPSGTELPIFPEIFEDKPKSVVLVEGIFDMLNLYDKGLTNVACTFGTTTLFRDTDLKLLSLKTQGISKIYLMYDGDKPGQEAMDKLEPLIQEAGYITEKIVLQEDQDPGELDEESVRNIKEWINEKDLHSR